MTERYETTNSVNLDTATQAVGGPPGDSIPDTHSSSMPRLLGNRYLLEEEIAGGGMASVWRAHDEKLARTVAVKVLHQHLANAEDFKERFRREAISAAKLSHPGIVGVYDTGTHSGWVYLVMEYVPGPTLADVIAQQAPMDWETVAKLGQRVATALHVANKTGLIHRDVKPANILISPSGTPKVTDFGIAKAEDAASDLTRTGMVLGTAAYLAPEQIRGQSLDHRADQYSLGCVLYEALTGRPPFTAKNSMDVAALRLRTDPVDIRALRTGIPKGFAAAIMRALQRDSGERHPDNAAFANALEPFIAVEHSSGSTVAPDDTRFGTDVPLQEGQHSFFRSEGRWLGVVLALLAAAVVLVGAGLITGVLRADGIPSVPMLEEIGLGGSSDDDTVENARFIPSADRLQAFDPEGDQRENNDQLALAVDGDASTAWRTETYKTRADFGGLKPGVGIIVDLAEFMTISGVEIETATPGITVSLLSADEPADSLSGWNEREAPTLIEGEATIEFESVESRYLLMWLTGDLPPADEGAWRAEINELAVLTPSG